MECVGGGGAARARRGALAALERDLDLVWDLNMGMRVGRCSGSVWLALGRPEGWGGGGTGT